jgi:hypothetical protein
MIPSWGRNDVEEIKSALTGVGKLMCELESFNGIPIEADGTENSVEYFRHQ